MEKKLTITHIAPYLPYGLKAINCFNQEVEVIGLQNGNSSVNNGLWIFKNHIEYLKGYLYECKPILRPLSQLTQEIEHNGERFVPVERLEYTYSTLGVRATIEQLAKDNRWVNHCEYLLIQHLLEWHFDINNLLSDGLAIEKGAEG